MPRFRLRTLLIVLALGPPVLAGAWRSWRMWEESRHQREFDKLIPLIQTIVPNSSGS